MEILRYALGQMQANCYFIVNGSNCIIVDPADDASFILEEIQRKRLNLLGMFATHGHFDHLMAVGEIQTSFNIPFYIFKEDQFLIDRQGETAQHFLGYKVDTIKPLVVKYLNEGDILKNSFGIKVIKVSGHTPGSCAFYIKKEKTILTGDTLFKQGVGRYDFSYCSKEDLKKSLRKIMEFPGETKILPGHGEESTVSQEKDFIDAFLNNRL